MARPVMSTPEGPVQQLSSGSMTTQPMAAAVIQSDVKTAAPDSWSCTHVKVRKATYVWIIKKFRLLENLGDEMNSTPFSAADDDKLRWRLRIFPKGADEESKNDLSVFLVLDSGNSCNVRAEFKISILNAKGQETVIARSPGVVNFAGVQPWGLKKFARKDLLFNELHGLLPDDKLTLSCEVRIFLGFEEHSVPNNAIPFNVPKSLLKDDLGHLLENKLFSDVILSVHGRELPAHKNILAARSPVFASLFEGHVEKTPNRVEVLGVEYDVLLELLRFIYTGRVLNIDKVAKGLLVAADLCALDRLISMCEEALCSSLTVETAAGILLFANAHRAAQLKGYSIDWICARAEEVLLTEGWKALSRQQPRLVSELCRALATQKAAANSQPLKRAKYF